MGDIKLFRIRKNQVEELPGSSVAVEKSLQTLIENNLETFLGIRFLASEYSTGKTHGGRIDTLGIDENHSPVIIEYKRATNQNVINQGLYYLDWLMDHQGEFTLTLMKKFGKQAANSIDWSNPRLLCIAGGFTKYDEYAVQQIHRNIELYEYKHYGNLLMLNLVNAKTATRSDTLTTPRGRVRTARSSKTTISENIANASEELRDRYELLDAFITALGDDVQKKVLKHYIAFKRITNFACVEVYPKSNKILLYLKLNPDKIRLKKGFIRDVRKIGHYGTGDLEVTIRNDAQLEKAKNLIIKSYDAN